MESVGASFLRADSFRSEKSEMDKKLMRIDGDLVQVNLQQEQLTEEINKFHETMEQIIEQERQQTLVKLNAMQGKIDSAGKMTYEKVMASDDLEEKMRHLSKEEFSLLKLSLDSNKDSDMKVSESKLAQLQREMQIEVQRDIQKA